MAEFRDSEAVESNGEGAEEMDSENDVMIQNSVNGDHQNGNPDEENEVADEGEVVNDLIDDNPIEEADDSDDDSDALGKRKKSDDDDLSDTLEDDDYDLIEENLGVKFPRALKKFKRLKRIDDSDEEDSQDQVDQREAIANQLFEGSDNEDDRREPVREEAIGHYASEESNSETDDFIVDDAGVPLKDGRRKRSTCTDAHLQEAQDIFGVDFDELEKYGEEYDEEEEDEDGRPEKRTRRRWRKGKSIYELFEPHELERAGFTDEDNKIRSQDVPERMQLRGVPITPATGEELDEEAEWIFKTAFSERNAKKVPIRKGPVSFAPTAVEANWDADWDKQTAVPGGARSTIQTANANDENWEKEEDWGNPSTSASAAAVAVRAPIPIPRPAGTVVGEENWEDEDAGSTIPIHKEKPTAEPSASSASDQDQPQRKADEAKPQIIPKIRKALEFMRNEVYEVPFIAFYRKEYVSPDLSIDDLWKIYRLDARFCQLKKRKCRLAELFRNMREHQTETDAINASPDAPISESMRLITDEDIDRIQAIKSTYELKDMYSLFTLYYGDDVPAMKKALIKKRKEERLRKKAEAAAAAAERGESENGEDEHSADLDDGLDQDPVIEEPVVRRKAGGGPYALCKKVGVDSFVRNFGLSPDKFAENLRDNYRRHEVDQYQFDPIVAAEDVLTDALNCNNRLKTVEEVVKAGKFMMATQISREPLVRQCVREVFFERATISCYPTKKGSKAIDEAHPCFTMKYLKDKPVTDLAEDQFLKLTLAEEDGLLTLEIGDQIKGMASNTYVDEVKQLFQKDEFSKLVQDWNTLRGECIEFTLEKLLYPVLRKELRAKLLEDAKEHILKTSCNKLHNWLKVAPYETSFHDEDDEEWDTSKGLRVLAIAYVPDYEQASFACIISPDGEPSDYLRLPNLIKSKNALRETDKTEKEADLIAMKNFIRNKKPHVIVIGGESREALMIQTEVKELNNELVNEDAFPLLNVEILDNQLAKVYANSLKAANDFRDYPLILRQAVSLGRRMLDPLIEFSQLCNADQEILCMRFHTLQDHIPKEELLEHLQLEFVNRTNEVGVDVNRAIQCPYTSNLVQFTCGLGPRKATALLKTLKQTNQRLENRSQLINLCHMGPKVFINCAGFIKIDTNSLGDSTESYIEVLDGSRVHPETYEWARKMAVDALEYDDEDANPASALEEILESPEKLKDLDLDAFAVELEKQGLDNRSITLHDIRAELSHRYKDKRIPYESPNNEETFNMLTKETLETLYTGKLFTATVIGIAHKKPQGDQLDNAIPLKNETTGMWQCAFCGKNDFPELSEVWAHFDAGACPGQATGVRIRLDNGIPGFIPTAKLSDSQVTNPEERVRRGQTIHCRVVKIDVDRFSVECTSKTSDLRDTKGEWKPQKDMYYDQEREDLEIKKEDDIRRNQQRQTYIKRVIVHPSFKNITFQDAEKLMETMDQGEVIVRPSSKGADHLTVTWKVADGVYQHIDVREEGKENAFSLGQSLWIGNDEFEDLDEITARFVAPMAGHAREIINYKYYVGHLGGSREKAEQYLQQERAKNSSKSHYIFQASKEYPGKFLLSYLPSTRPAHEFVTVTPEGFRYRQQNFDNLNLLLNWFKEHYCDAPPAIMPFITPRSQGTRAPYVPVQRYDYDDGVSCVGLPAPLPSRFNIRPPIPFRPANAPFYATPTPSSAYTPYSSYSRFTPYSPISRTPFMTRFQTPYQPGQQTPYQTGPSPRFPPQNQVRASSSNSVNSNNFY